MEQLVKQQRFGTQHLELPVVPDFDAIAIKHLREELKISQETLADVLNTSLSTVRQWEIGRKRPGGTSAKLLDLLKRKGLQALI